MSLIIDPPVTVVSPRKAIERWIEQLAELRRKHQEDESALAIIDQATEEARRWLEFKASQG